MIINIEKLREDLYEEFLGAYFGGGYGAALFDASDVKKASPEELIEMAKSMGFDIRKYTG